MDYEKLKEVIAKQIKENGKREITGPVLQAVLMAMVDSLGEVYPHTYTDEEKAQARANIDALSNHNGEITKEKLSLEVQAILNDVANKQNISDATLATIAKTIVGAINEVYKGGLEDASIATSKIKDGAITDAKIANGAVTTPKIANDAVTTEKVYDGAITEPKLDTDLVNIITSAVQPAELASAIASALASYVAKADIVDTTGSATDKVMSQKAVTDNLALKSNTDDVYTKNAVDNLLLSKASQAGLDAEAELRANADAALNTALAAKANSADVYTKAQADAITNALADSLSRILRDFGMYLNPTEYVLVVGVSGKYIDKDSALEVANSNYSISQPFSLKAGDILLVPSASAVTAACSVVSKKVTNTYDKVIIYAYTYDEFGRINTATADYNPSLVYTAYYESDEQTTPTDWMIGGEHIAELPQTHEVTESFYEPLVKQSVAGMPDTGYYVYLASQAMDVVVSAYNATINGGHAIIAGWGIFENVATNFVGIDKQRVIAEAIADLFAQVEGINEKLTNGLDSLSVKHLHIDRELSGLNIAGTFCLQGAGVPSASVEPVNWDFGRYGDWEGIPQFIGQEYFDTIDKVFYKAHGVNAVSDWKRITNA